MNIIDEKAILYKEAPFGTIFKWNNGYCIVSNAYFYDKKDSPKNGSTILARENVPIYIGTGAVADVPEDANIVPLEWVLRILGLKEMTQ